MVRGMDGSVLLKACTRNWIICSQMFHIYEVKNQKKESKAMG
jgi:hypothetical protein